MRLANLVSLTGADLRSEPAITQIESIILCARKIRRGDLFVARDPRDIPEALSNGAYAVLYACDYDAIDNEIAWLKVDDVDDALLRLLRFHLLGRGAKAVGCDDVTLSVAAQILRDERCVVVQNDLFAMFDVLWELPEASWAFVPLQQCWKDLFVEVVPLRQTKSLAVDIVEQTLFETSFILDGVYYERMQLSPFFLPYLAHLCAYAQNNSIHFQVSGMQSGAHFVPVFVGDDLRIKTFGHGGKVLIFEPDISLLLHEAGFIREEAKWAKIIYLAPADLEVSFEELDAVRLYGDSDDLVNILKTCPFHFALIGGRDRKWLESVQPRFVAPTLF